ncbi:MAG: glucose-6-phosphate isomerase, partial [Rhodothermaceae bacterium]|nr:glucose-6-phosphate isomerase [Rhodothermaceae bacterium]
CAAGLVFGYWAETPALLQIAYPAAALLVAALLYASAPAYYLGFAWWIWFVTPFVRRLVDYQALSFSTASPVMLTPYLVTGLCLITLFRFGGRLTQRRYVPVLLVLLGLGYGYLVGVVKAGLWAATFDLLEWVTPVLLGFHVLVFWRLYPVHRRVVRAAFGWGVLVLGVYGVVQFFAPAAWDAHWMVASGMTSSIGQPEAYQLRVFSMLNSPGPFAMVMMAGLLLLLGERGPLARLAVVPGYAGFLLSLVRGAWGGWLLGLLYAVRGLRGTGRRRLLAVLVLSALTLLPLMVYAPAVERVTHRFDSFVALEQDTSFNARLRLYANVSGQVLANPVGRGLGSLGRAAKLGGGR